MSVEDGIFIIPILMYVFGAILFIGFIILIVVLLVHSNKGIKNPEFAKNALIQNGFVLSDVTKDFVYTQVVSSAFLGVKNDIEIHLFLLYPNSSIDFIENLYNPGQDKVSNHMMTSTPGSVTVSFVHDGNYIKYRKYKDTLVYLKCNQANEKEANEYLKQMYS